MKRYFCTLGIISLTLCGTQSHGEDKVALDPPRQEGATAPEGKGNLAEELKAMPDGVLRVRTNSDGSFKSLVVKATVEVEDVLGGQKGKRLGRREAEIACKRALSQWLSDNCVFAEASDHSTTILTKGESSKDAAGNTVKLRKQEGKETKILTENYASVSAACLQGLIVLQSEVTPGDNPEYVLVMGLSQQTLSQAGAVKEALSANGKPATAKPAVNAGGKKTGNAADDKPAAEIKTNPDAKDF